MWPLNQEVSKFMEDMNARSYFKGSRFLQDFPTQDSEGSQ